MKFRVARHTAHLKPIINFYTQILGLSILGDFKDHDGYDGVFLGLPGSNWHLEFTTSNENPVHWPDEDDVLVFYFDAEAEYIAVQEKFRLNDIEPTEPKNPYWKTNGLMYTDPDGFRVIITMESK